MSPLPSSTAMEPIPLQPVLDRWLSSAVIILVGVVSALVAKWSIRAGITALATMNAYYDPTDELRHFARQHQDFWTAIGAMGGAAMAAALLRCTGPFSHFGCVSLAWVAVLPPIAGFCGILLPFPLLIGSGFPIGVVHQLCERKGRSADFFAVALYIVLICYSLRYAGAWLDLYG